MNASGASTGPRPKRLRGARGFSLLELIVVVALVAVVISLVAPSMRDLIASQRVQSINAELVTDLQFARAEAVRRNLPVLVEFSQSAGMTCYVMYLSASVGRCNCLRPPGSACAGGFEEIRTVQVPRSLAVSLSASSPRDRIVTFEPVAGLSEPGQFQVDVVGTVRGTMRTSLNVTGRPTVCSPDGSISQVPRCPE